MPLLCTVSSIALVVAASSQSAAESPRAAELIEVPEAPTRGGSRSVFDIESEPTPAGGPAEGSAGTPSMPPIEELPSRDPDGAGAPAMPPIEELPARGSDPDEADGAANDPWISGVKFGGPKDRKPVAGGGVGFFDPGKLEDAGAAGGGVVQIRGYVGLNFAVTERTDITGRNPETGRFDQLKTLPYFGGGAANLFVGAPIYADVVYARIAFEFLSIPRALPGSADVSPASEPVVIMESAALEVNPFAWAKRSPDWFRVGFKLTGGVFIVPFGLEDQQHDAPVRWFVSRPLAMSTGRVYPGSWIDAGLVLKWHPRFPTSRKSMRPIEIDIGVINGDACTQTRATDLLYRYQPLGQVVEVCEHQLRDSEIVPRGDGSVLGITPDNNGNKSVLARLQVRPIGALNLGGSFVWGTHPPSGLDIPDFQGMTFIDAEQAPTWRAGAHLDLNLDEAIQSKFPLPHIRGEFVYGLDAAIPVVAGDQPTLSDRRMMGAYAQIAQPLWRRKKTRLPGLIVQYRFDFSDPDLDVPRVSEGGGAVRTDFADNFLYDEAMQGHIFGLRFPVLPRFALKAEYGWLLEDGGAENQLHNNFFSLQAVADF